MTSFVGDVGTEIIVEFQAPGCSGTLAAFDVSTATEIKICLRRPDLTIVERVVTFTAAPCGVGDGTDGKASFITILSDFDQKGTYEVAGKVTLATGEIFYSSESKFTVDTPICT